MPMITSSGTRSPTVHERFRLAAQLRAGLYLKPEHVARRQVDRAEFVRKCGSLCAFARARRSQKNDTQIDSPTLRRYLIKPS